MLYRYEVGVFLNGVLCRFTELLVGDFFSATAEKIESFINQILCKELEDTWQQFSVGEVARGPEDDHCIWSGGRLGANNIFFGYRWPYLLHFNYPLML